MGVEASSDEAHAVHDPGQDLSIENELTEYIRATDPVSEEKKAWATQLGGDFYFSLNKRD